MAVRESLIEDYLVQEVKKLGGERRKVKWIGRRGAPDNYVMFYGRCFWAEIKATGEALDSHQIREFILMQEHGATIYIIDSFDKVDQMLAGTLPQWGELYV